VAWVRRLKGTATATGCSPDGAARARVGVPTMLSRRPWRQGMFSLEPPAAPSSGAAADHVVALAIAGRVPWPGFSQVQGFDRPEPPGPDSVRPEGRGRHRLHGDQPHDPPRHAGLPEGRLNTGTEGEVCPQPHLCTKAFPDPSGAPSSNGVYHWNSYISAAPDCRLVLAAQFSCCRLRARKTGRKS
jgi:hypothetical protein